AARLHGANVRKLLDRDALTERVRGWRHAGKRVVLTNGCFDLLHAGHLALLHQAAQYGDVLIVAINSDASIRRLKGPGRPVVPAPERTALLAALTCVDAVTLFREDTPLELLRAIHPDVLVKGQDYQLKEVIGREIVESNGGRVVLVPLVADKSTTASIERITSRYSDA
ncbi:MAG TPA: D-glycero-beta-D-manno-heptose 1-phosphate adenylyltransferase, partial [Rhodanobacteraceae bacterium]